MVLWRRIIIILKHKPRNKKIKDTFKKKKKKKDEKKLAIMYNRRLTTPLVNNPIKQISLANQFCHRHSPT